MVDIGTNGEVAVGTKECIVAASNAAGGAFEGATISCGTAAVQGAMVNITIDKGQVGFETIGGREPIGICGSGLIDLLAQMLKDGIIDENGRFTGEHQERRYFDVVPGERPVRMTQKDINELRLAKAGLVVNQRTLLRRFGIGPDELGALFLVGGFGHYVNPDEAVAIGLLPDMSDRFQRRGNAALTGARQMLLSRQRRDDAERLAVEIEHVKLFEEENILDRYVGELGLKRWR
jgi:uncharacterized 2Fe-2S/4Fe-4S cluster protein (DUF4445 family)